MNSYTRRKPCNHGLHLFMTIITLGMWGVFVWPFAALRGRRETVTYHPQRIQLAPPVPLPQPNAVNPYNGNPYWDGYARQIQYPPSHPVNYGR